jgi:16S rRNA (guanine527-N7)-methyltransferase
MTTEETLNHLLQTEGQPSLNSREGNAFSEYLSLLLKWNSKLNLTAIREPELILRRHFFECVLCARLIPEGVSTLLDFGSGGGFPGIPIAICRPEIEVTLGESQSKKAAFLREVIRTLHLKSRVEHRRAETIQMTFQAVSLRAVDKMEQAVGLAAELVTPQGYFVLMAGRGDLTRFQAAAPRFTWKDPFLLPGTTEEVILIGTRLEG